MNFIEQKNYDINNSDSKNFCIEDNSNDFISKYYILINQYIALYIEYIYENINVSSDKKYRYYILLKGLEMLTNIIHITIMYTNNIDLTFYYCNKAYYYYLEFISQIDIDNNHLELNIKDAIIFVYKKTIFDIKEPITTINNLNINLENIQKIENIRLIINIINTYVKIFKLKDIINLNINKERYIKSQINIDKHFLKIINKLEKMYINENQFNVYILKLDNILNTILKVFNKFNIINNDSEDLDNIINFDMLILLIDKLLIKCYQINNNLDYENIITRDNLTNLTNVRVRQIISSINE